MFFFFFIFVCGSTVFEDRTVLLLILILQEGKPAPTAPGAFLQVRFLVLERRSQSSPFAIDFDRYARTGKLVLYIVFKVLIIGVRVN